MTPDGARGRRERARAVAHRGQARAETGAGRGARDQRVLYRPVAVRHHLGAHRPGRRRQHAGGSTDPGALHGQDPGHHPGLVRRSATGVLGAAGRAGRGPRAVRGRADHRYRAAGSILQQGQAIAHFARPVRGSSLAGRPRTASPWPWRRRATRRARSRRRAGRCALAQTALVRTRARAERLHQVRPEILDVLEADAEAKQAGRDRSPSQRARASSVEPTPPRLVAFSIRRQRALDARGAAPRQRRRRTAGDRTPGRSAPRRDLRDRGSARA